MTKFSTLLIGASMALCSFGAAYAQEQTRPTSEKGMPMGAETPAGVVPTGRSDSMSKSNPASPSNPAPASETGKPSGGKENPKIGQ